MPKESVLSEAEKESFQIEKFIFHIIIESEHTPVYLEEVILDEKQNEFFKMRFRDISEGTQFIFKDRSKSDFVAECEKLVGNAGKNFIESSKKLAYQFKNVHNKATNDGVFIAALVTVAGNRQLILLLKLEHKKVYQYKTHKAKALLEEIKNTFVEDKKAIQKAALIDISDYYKWDVLATDKTALHSANSLTEYFSNFLDVVELETATVLTEHAMKYAFKWAVENSSELDPDQEISSYKSRAIAYLSNTNKFDTEDFISIVVKDDNVERRQKLAKSFKAFLDEKGLSGQTFAPSKSVLTKRKTKNVRQTAEGIKIEWEGDPEDLNLNIPTEKDSNGYLNILIKTTNIRILDNK
ncbi:nucleoid-associated protein [Chitinophaga horti]|uniref:Nucleoid-associated protein n=1 Tax=Chitinophaga horti TaxID=2920382 RepID=A0ABY6IXM5_9BACT|nr:nucleoid-associated protein [Chitinophaga horti]UYQ92133.1 nucleoid-associated protein [Chitinophaga horti]